jgi:quinol monooxygenase YgiN
MTIPEDKVADYLKAAETVDDAVNESEPGMLHHTFDQDPDDPCKFVWSECYSSDAALLNHLVNPPVGAYLGAHTELCGGLDEKTFTVEIYGTLADATKEEANKLPVPVKYFDTKFGYNRGRSWKK